MAYWIDENYINIENILRFSEYSGYNPGRVRKFPKESDIVSIIGIRSDRIDVFILLKENKFDNIPEDTLFIQTNDFNRLVLSGRYRGVFYKGNINTVDNYYALELLSNYDLVSAELLRFIEDTKEYIENNWRKKDEEN